MSEVNEEHTLNDISVLADRLASEIVTHVREKKIFVEKLSFVCHSLGGLIARCAIQTETMNPFREKFETFISLATPHLSLYFHNNSLVGSALKLYQFVGKSKCIDQLNLKDISGDPRSSLLYKLAMGEENGLYKFKHVKFFGSPQDGYVPITSSLLNVSDLKARQGEDSDVSAMIDTVLEMAEKLSSIPSLEKFSVQFGTLFATNFDVLGRKAHIAMLTEPALMEMLVLLNNAHI
ncbi:UNVERIFIED_CONTAM: hypothetical protein HDU68_010799 [Siphonaria sp. JEL0065]|nr:hypothetical protein HDU68_010799 [Siphonaria sp. JEL0065]